MPLLHKLTHEKRELERKLDESLKHLAGGRDPCESTRVMDDVFRYLESSLASLDELRAAVDKLKYSDDGGGHLSMIVDTKGKYTSAD
jgi:hypothetical protein